MEQFRRIIRGGQVEKERIILAGLRAFLRYGQPAALRPQSPVVPERAVEKHVPQGMPYPRRFFRQRGAVVQPCHRFQRRRVEHIAGGVHILHQLVGLGPLHKHPRFQLFQQPQLVFKALEIIQRVQQMFLCQFRHFPVAGAADVLLRFQQEPQHPVGDKVAVARVGGVAHGDHARFQPRIAFRQEIVFQIGFFRPIGPGQRPFGPPHEEAVAAPARPFPGGAVGKKIVAVLPQGLHGGMVDLPKQAVSYVLWQRRIILRRGGGFQQVQTADGAATLGADQLEVLHRCRFKGREAMNTPAERQLHSPDQAHSERIHVPIRQNLIIQSIHNTGFVPFDLHRKEARFFPVKTQPRAVSLFQTKGQRKRHGNGRLVIWQNGGNVPGQQSRALLPAVAANQFPYAGGAAVIPRMRVDKIP